jgi:hypothetical protein
VPNSLKIKFILEGYKLAHLCSFWEHFAAWVT